MPRILLTTFGSLGDLHPYIALALELKARGHDPVIGTGAPYREKVEALGIGFAAIRPDHESWLADPELMKRIMDLRHGSEFIVRDLFMPIVGESYEDTLAAAEGADLLVSHPLTFGTPLVAEQRRLPWASTMLSPLGFFSAHDPPVLPPAQFLAGLRFLGPLLWKPLFGVAKWSCRNWSAPYYRLRSEIGLPATRLDPLFEGQHSPHLVLGMFSDVLAQKQRDWPGVARVTGFAFYDRDDAADGLPDGLARFLEAGPPPIVFTLGSSAVHDAGSFYRTSAAAAERLGHRAVLLIGRDERNRSASLPDGVAAFEYAPYSELFPRAAAIVHQGGAGTTGQALRAGRPMLVMPYAHDQPDYAHRIVRLGVGRTIARDRYTVDRVVAELGRLLDDPGYRNRAEEAGRHVSREDGVRTACDALEQLVDGKNCTVAS